jgi:hypothetical protein
MDQSSEYTENCEVDRIPKCEKCELWYPYGGITQKVAMSRVYIKDKGKWKTIGWICPICGKFTLTHPLPLKKYVGRRWLDR